MKVVLDHCIERAWAGFLIENGIEAVVWADVGDPKAQDYEIMEWAKRNQAVVLTGDADFGTILWATSATKPSVVRISTHETRVSRKGIVVLEILKRHAERLQAGAFVSVDEDEHRVRPLPMTPQKVKPTKEQQA
jgi:predicted nuclease of predicted toxin-antitoxin system